MWQTQSYNNAIDNFKVEKSASKSAQNLCRIHKNGVQNFHFIGHRILKTLRNIFGDRSFASAGPQVTICHLVGPGHRLWTIQMPAENISVLD